MYDHTPAGNAPPPSTTHHAPRTTHRNHCCITCGDIMQAQSAKMAHTDDGSDTNTTGAYCSTVAAVAASEVYKRRGRQRDTWTTRNKLAPQQQANPTVRVKKLNLL